LGFLALLRIIRAGVIFQRAPQERKPRQMGAVALQFKRARSKSLIGHDCENRKKVAANLAASTKRRKRH
jgi:hypothetical protein